MLLEVVPEEVQEVDQKAVEGDQVRRFSVGDPGVVAELLEEVESRLWLADAVVEQQQD